MKILIGRKNHFSVSAEAKASNFRVRSDHDELLISNCSQVSIKKLFREIRKTDRKPPLPRLHPTTLLKKMIRALFLSILRNLLE